MQASVLGSGPVFRTVLAIALAFCGILPAPRPASATSWTVCATGCSFSTIAGALVSATVVNGDTLQLTDAVYGENNLNVTKSLTIAGSGTSPAIGKSSPAGSIFFVSGAVDVTFQNLVVQNGVSTSTDLPGGITSSDQNTRLTLDQVTVRNNRNTPAGQANGGGIHSGGPLTITNSTVISNSAIGGLIGSVG
jgi:hypothetical protein